VPSRRLCAAAFAALAIAGCGGDGQSKADFIAAADKICLERDTSAANLSAVGSEADLGRLSGELAAIYDKAITDLEAVSLPGGDARAGAVKYVRATAGLRTAVDGMREASQRFAAAARTQQASALRSAGEQLQGRVNTVQALGDIADEAARDYGMRTCGQTSRPLPVS